ncbi:hypothetical protein [Microvirga massiliensis]|uniref:hypothetical protein n=1 Tax=Microvirga massiliensis TaxID=1033741 RepID=UPI00062B8C2B|nr:hypothetical protein [Microvirga massiliensis]
MTVVISLKDLAGVVGAATKTQSSDEALEAIGFEPARGRVVARQGRAHEPLKCHRGGNSS